MIPLFYVKAANSSINPPPSRTENGKRLAIGNGKNCNRPAPVGTDRCIPRPFPCASQSPRPRGHGGTPRVPVERLLQRSRTWNGKRFSNREREKICNFPAPWSRRHVFVQVERLLQRSRTKNGKRFSNREREKICNFSAPWSRRHVFMPVERLLQRSRTWNGKRFSNREREKICNFPACRARRHAARAG